MSELTNKGKGSVRNIQRPKVDPSKVIITKPLRIREDFRETDPGSWSLFSPFRRVFGRHKTTNKKLNEQA